MNNLFQRQPKQEKKDPWQKLFKNFNNGRSYFTRNNANQNNLDDNIYQENNVDMEDQEKNRQNGKNDAVQSIEFKERGNECLKANLVDEAI